MQCGRAAVPIHDLGYRPWEGRTTPQLLRWWPIAQSGIKIAWKNYWLRRLLLLAWIPAFYLGIGFFVYEQWVTRVVDWAAQQAGADETLKPFIHEVLAGRPLEKVPAAQRQAVALAVAIVRPHLQQQMIEQGWRRFQAFLPDLPPTIDRHEVWCGFMAIFFRYPQGVLMLLVVGLAAPPLISRDVGSRAFLLYFSRPIVCAEYVFGKLCTLWVFLLLISAAPALALYAFGVLLSPSLTVVVHTWDLPLRIFVASVVLLVPTSTFALALSSATTRSWVAGFAWFAVWVFGFMAYNILWMGLDLMSRAKEDAFVRYCSLISFHHTLGKVQSWVFRPKGDWAEVLPSIVVLVVLTVISLGVLARRVSSPMRI